MKQAIQRVLPVLVALALCVNVPQAARSEDGSSWNPMNWFSQEEAPQSSTPKQPKISAEEAMKQRLKDAQAKAEAARIRAEQALNESEAAQKELQKVQREADQLAGKHTKKAHNKQHGRNEKPVVQAEPAKPVRQAAEVPPDKKSDWNPMNWFSGSEGEKQASAETASTDARNAAKAPAGMPDNVADWTPAMLKTKAVQVSTEKGNIFFELYPDEAPITVRNFVKLVNQHFYDNFNMKFHRVIPGFVVQTGDPTGTGAGGSKERIPLEVKNKLTHDAKGVVAMARGPDPNSASSQFYITLAPEESLDGKYAIFGRVIAGLDVLDKIEKGDMLYGVSLVDMNTVTRDAPPERKGMFGMFGGK